MRDFSFSFLLLFVEEVGPLFVSVLFLVKLHPIGGGGTGDSKCGIEEQAGTLGSNGNEGFSSPET